MSEMLNKNDEQTKKKSKMWIWAIVATFALIVMISSCSNNTTSQQNSTSNNSSTASSSQQNKVDDSKYVKAGMYKVGADLPAGEYLMYASGSAYFEVASDSKGTLDSIVANDNFTSTRYITVENDQYLEIKNAKMLLSSKAEPQKPTNGEYKNGMYKVGTDIQPGEYKVAAVSGSGYFEVDSDSYESLDSIVSNDNFQGEKYVTISSGQYLKLSNAKVIVK